MNKDLSHESNATLLSSLLNIPAENLACKNISDILTAPMSITGVGTKKVSKIYVIKEVVRRIMEESPNDTPTISIGSLSASVVHPREVFAETIKYSCASIILVHNHPSGDPTPSREDIAVTERLVKAGKVMDIPVLDHIIIGNKKYCSLKEKGNME